MNDDMHDREFEMPLNRLASRPPDSGESEPHFRRGFHHGAIRAIDAIEAGATIEELRHWAENDVSAWRDSYAAPEWPPEPPYPSK